MFGKLMKYELRASLRIFLPIWGCLLILAAVNGFTINLSETEGVAAFLSFLIPLIMLMALLTAVFVIALIFIIRRYYSGLLEDEGYLMLTLPVKTSSIIGSKALTALIIEALSVIVVGIVALIIFMVQPNIGFWDVLSATWRELGTIIKEDPKWVLLAVEFVFFLLVMAMQFILRLYTAMSIGHLAPKHRVVCSCAAFLGIWIVLTIISSIFDGFCNPFIDVINLTDLNADTSGQLCTVMLIPIAWQLALSVIFFITSHQLLKKKVNLE